ncbi:MAG: hypothetical protein B6V02_01050 [Thermoprotei archaeon ex4572_64]|nr:MAG: hypothetical protein B6V02_01050 [Thermoprotei archaeon ex4572_64]
MEKSVTSLSRILEFLNPTRSLRIYIKKLKYRNVELYYSYLLLFMNILALSGFSLRTIFKIVSESKISQDIQRIFKKLVYLIEKWNYELKEACNVMSRETIGNISSLFSKIVNAISLGIEPRDYFPIEYETHMSRYIDDHERRIERARRLADAYSAILSSLSFLSVTIVLLMMMYVKEGIEVVLMITILAFLLPLSSLVLIAYRAIPRFPIIITIDRPYTVHLIEKSIILIPPLLTVSTISSQYLHASLHPITISTFLPGIVMLIFGLLGSRILRRIRKFEEIIHTFIKSFCDAYVITTSLPKTISLLKLHEYGILNPLIRKMYARALMRVSIDIIFRQFAVETCSERVRIYMEILKNGIVNGASLRELSRLLTSHIVTELNLVKRREQISGYLTGLIIPLQASQAVVSALTLVLVDIFNKVLSITSQITMPIEIGAISILAPVSEHAVIMFFLILLLVTSVVSALMIYVTKGEANVNLTYYLGLILVIVALSFQATYYLMNYALQAMLKPLTTLRI